MKKKKVNPQRGETHTNAKLTHDRVARIRAIRKSEGISYAKIAALFKVSTATVCRICNQQGWRV